MRRSIETFQAARAASSAALSGSPTKAPGFAGGYLQRSTCLIDSHPRVRNSPELSEVGRPTYQRGRRHDDQRSILQPKRFQAAHCSREQASLFSSIPLFFR